ncbi:MAG: hypothetical protein E6K54_05820 [Gammaproteobacteria bacterium]|nr:MAG: hypothetical protein E6K54_05820 [Gammaproteobacteria bacterium]
MDLPAEIVLDELKKKESSPHALALIESINSQELTQSLFTPKCRLKFLESVILNQPSPVVLALLHKIDSETIKKLFNENTPFLKIKFLTFLLENYSTDVCITLLEKADKIGNFKINFKDKLIIVWENFKKAISSETLLPILKMILQSLVSGLVVLGIPAVLIIMAIAMNLTFLGLFILIPFVLFVVNFFVMVHLDSQLSTGLPIRIFGILIQQSELPFLALSLFAPLIIPMFVAYYLFAVPILAGINTKKEIKSLTPCGLLNNVLALQSDRLLALFFSNLSPQQLKTLNFPFELADIRDSLCSVSMIILKVNYRNLIRE